MDEVEVTVLCTVYNHARYLYDTLEGFVRQKTNFRFVVVIHDDASSDDSQLIIKQYGEKHPRLFKLILQKENQHSRGIHIYDKFLYPLVQSRYFAICEGDDYWCDEYKLQRQYDALEESPSCSVCTHVVGTIAEDGRMLRTSFPEIAVLESGVLPGDKLLKLIFTKDFYPFQTSSFFFRSDLLKMINGKGKDFLGSCPALDYGWILLSLCIGDCFFINEKMSNYRRFSNSSWSNRQRSSSVHERFLRKIGRSLQFFDRMTECRYHEQVEFCEHQIEFSLFSEKEKMENRKKIEYEIFYRRMTSTQKICTGICAVFPFLSRFYHVLKKIRSKYLVCR